MTMIQSQAHYLQWLCLHMGLTINLLGAQEKRHLWADLNERRISAGGMEHSEAE